MIEYFEKRERDFEIGDRFLRSHPKKRVG